MASLGLAWAQGRKNAQEAAKSQIATLLDLAKNASETDRTLEYFSPEQKAARNLEKEEMKLKVDKIKQWNALAPNIFANPEEAGNLLDMTMPTQGKWIVERSAGDPKKFIAREIFTDERGNKAQGRVQEFGSKNELLSTVGMQFTQTPREALKAVEGRYGKELEGQEKRATKLFEAQADYEYGKRQDIEAKLRAAQMQANASMYGSKMGYLGNVEGASIKQGWEAKDVPFNAKMKAVNTLGGTYDYTTKKFKIPVKIDGVTSLVDEDMAPPEAVAKVNTAALAGEAAFHTAKNRNLHPDIATMEASKAVADSLAPQLQGARGLPVAPTGPAATPWYNRPNLGKEILEKARAADKGLDLDTTYGY